MSQIPGGRLKAARVVCRIAIAIAAVASPAIYARGPSPYLPLDLAPGIERQIERVLILAGKPVMRRPIAAATVLEALPLACDRDPALCEEVRSYLEAYTQHYAVTSVRPQVSASAGDSSATLPNRHGQPLDSAWQISASGYYQPFDSLILNAGGVAYDGNATATGSFLSTGFDFAQLDVGFRDHWFSPSPDSASLISTEAPTMPSVTLSNYRLLTPLNLGYELFFAEMSRQDGIEYFDTTTSGKPRMTGLQLVSEPVHGYALAVSRVTQFGGGARNTGTSQFIDAITETVNGSDANGKTEFGNQVAALSSSLVFPGKVPFAVRLEFAGEDNAFKGKYRLGATNFTLGLDFPVLWQAFDLSFEVSEWQNVWYIHHIYPDGLVNRGHVLGHWFGDNRIFGDAIGGNSQTLSLGWRLPSGDYARGTYRRLAYDLSWAGVGATRPYETYQTLGIDYSTAWHGRPVDAELSVGQDIFGESFARLGLSMDFGKAFAHGSNAYGTEDDDEGPSVEVFVDVGAQQSNVREIRLDSGPTLASGYEANYHTAVGARRRVADRHDIGARIELDQVPGGSLVSLRAVDYRYRLWRQVAVSAFVGAARYDIGLPAYSYYWGAGLQYRDVLPGWDIGADFRQYDKFTRDRVLASDPPAPVQLPRRVWDIRSVSLYLSRRW